MNLSDNLDEFRKNIRKSDYFYLSIERMAKEYIDFIKIYIMKSIEQESSEKTKYDVFIDCNYNLDMYRIALNVSLKVAIQSIKTFFKTL